MANDQVPVVRAPKRTMDVSDGSSKKNKRTKTTILALPEECLRSITQNLTQEDTLSLLYSHSHFERACKVRLYRSIIICEKYQDHYFYELAKQKRVTILSGWDNILNFFRMFYMNNQQYKNLDLAKYVEEIATYNFLDRGRVDSYRVLSNSDLANILNLRQFWSTVLNSFVNLKVFVGPRLSLEKIFLLKERIALNLHKISISVENDLALGPLENYNIQLPHLKTLRLNVSPESKSSFHLKGSVIDIETCLALAKLLIVNGSKNNTTLEELELNASFGTQDRNTEHTLRHTKMTQGPSLTSSFISGFQQANSSLAHAKPRYSSNGLDYDSDCIDAGYRTDEDNEEEGERNEDDDIFNDLAVQYSSYTGGGNLSVSYRAYEDERLVYDSRDITTLPALRCASIKDFVFKLKKQKHEILITFMKILVQQGIKLSNLKKLAIVNMGLYKRDFASDSTFLKNFHILIPNAHELETLDLRNVYHDAFEFSSEDETDIQEEAEYFEFVENGTNSLIGHLTDYPSIQRFEKLKKLIFFASPNIGNIDYINEQISQYEFNPYLKLHDQLQAFTAKTPNLEELVIFGPESTKLKHFYRIIYKSHVKNVLKKLTFHQPQLIPQLCSKILNARIFRKFNKFQNLKILDDYYFGCSKKLTEHFISATRVDNYCQSDLLRSSNDTMFFKEEFLYLFADDAKRFFKICPNLEEFTLYGFTFKRNKNILV